jgi:hypothetical protein
VDTRPFQKRIYFCTFCALFCELSADFHAKESLTFSRKIRPAVVVVVELFVLFARARGTKDEKRASSSRSRGSLRINGIIRKDVQFGTTTTSTTTFLLCVAEDADDDVGFYRHQQQ